MKSQIIQVLHNRAVMNREELEHDTLFSALLRSDLPPEELSLIRLQHEAMSVVSAGLETTKRALSVASFHLLATPSALLRLTKELTDFIPDIARPPSLSELEALPYLSACIQESQSAQV